MNYVSKYLACLHQLSVCEWCSIYPFYKQTAKQYEIKKITEIYFVKLTRIPVCLKTMMNKYTKKLHMVQWCINMVHVITNRIHISGLLSGTVTDIKTHLH